MNSKSFLFMKYNSIHELGRSAVSSLNFAYGIAMIRTRSRVKVRLSERAFSWQAQRSRVIILKDCHEWLAGTYYSQYTLLA